MKTLFIAFDKNYPLDTAGNIVVFKHDLLNDIMYELGAEMAFMTKDDSIGDKTRIITDIKDARPEDYDTIVERIQSSIISKLMLPEVPEEASIIFPDSYTDWLVYNSDRSYAEIGNKLRGRNNTITLCLTDVYQDYITEKVLSRISDIVKSDNDICKFTVVDVDNSESAFATTVKGMRANLEFEPYNDGWVQNEIGYAHNTGIGALKDLEKSFKHYLISAEKRNPVGANWIGWCYQQGLGVPKDLTKALFWYNIGAELKNHASEANAAFFYENGMATSVDFNKAVELYERALADNNNIGFALNNLANIYYTGKLGTPDYAKAFPFYVRGANISEVSANCSFMAGWMLYYGQGVEKNDKEALEYLEKASKEGVNGAHILAGKLHADGVGTDFGVPDYERAKIAYQRGRDAGDDKCALELARIFISEGNSSSSNVIDNLRFASDKNNNDASFELAKYLHDNNVESRLGDTYAPVTLLTKLAEANYAGAEELRARYQKEIDDENARIEQERIKREEAEQEAKQERERQEHNEDMAFLDVKMAYEAADHYLKEMPEYNAEELYTMFVNGARNRIPIACALMGLLLADGAEGVIKCSNKERIADLILSSIKPVSTDIMEQVRAAAERKDQFDVIENFYQTDGIAPLCYAIVGSCYFYGIGLPQDEKKGLHYLKTSIGENPIEYYVPDGDESGYGYFVLANLYRIGKGVVQDLKKADDYYGKAYATDGIPFAPAQKALVQRKIYGNLSTMRTFPELMIMGAKKHDPIACMHYAKLISEQSKSTAEDWINKAIKYSAGNQNTLQSARRLMAEIGGTPDDYTPEEPFSVYFDEVGPTTVKPQQESITEKEEITSAKQEPECDLELEPIVFEAPTVTEEQPKTKKNDDIPQKQQETSEGDLKAAFNMMQGALKDNLRKTVEDLKDAATDAAEKKGGLFGRLFGKKK